jgi:hypothetical protein
MLRSGSSLLASTGTSRRTMLGTSINLLTSAGASRHTCAGFTLHWLAMSCLLNFKCIKPSDGDGL